MSDPVPVLEARGVSKSFGAVRALDNVNLSVYAGEILALIGEGLTNRQIGQRLYLAEKTVKNHISRLLAKLGVERRIQAAVIATQVQDRLRQEGR